MHSWKRNQTAVTAAAFVGFTGFTLVMPFLPLYIRQLGVTDVGEIALWTGVTLGVSPAIAALTAPLWGRVGDRFGSKLLVQRSLISFIFAMSAMAYATKAWHLFALRALQGFFAGYGPLTLSMAARSAPREKLAVAIGAVQTAQRMGPAVGPIIGGILAPLFGLRNSFFVAAGFYAIAFVVVTVLYREPPRVARGAGDRPKTPLASIFAFENFLLVMGVIFGLQLVDRSFGPVLPLYLGQVGYSAADVPMVAGVLFSVLALTAAFGHHLSGRLLGKHTPRLVIVWAVLIGAVALGLFTLTRGIWLMGASMAVVGLCIGTSITTAFAAGGAVIPEEVHATAFGFLTFASLSGVAISPVLAGLLAAHTLAGVFVTAASILAILAVVVRRVMVERALPVESAPAVEES
ncbi:MAG: MFS transporter [Acidobacteria bacterium]|nr:MFS transporter [Acidobacteriota bacterium]